jgi:flagellar assembly protein FliH
MNSEVWRETICFNGPPRHVQLAGEEQAPGVLLEEQLRARYEQGLRAGEKSLREQLLQQRSDVLEMQKGVLQALKQILPQVRSDCETALIDLALEVARKLVAGLPISPEMVEGAVREALAHVEETQQITVLLNSEDSELLRRVNSPVLLATAGGEKVCFETSPEVSRGGCLVQTRFGVLDARRETKFELLKKSLQT